MGELLRYLFDKTQHVVKTSAAGYVPVCYEVINLFIKPQNFLLMGFICKFKGLCLIVMACDGLLMFFLDLFDSCIKSTRYDVFQDVFLKWFTLQFMVLSIFPRGVHTVDPPFSLEEGPRSYIFF